MHLFIFCSGCGLYLAFLNKETGFKVYMKQRFSKIYVSYIIIVLISFCIPFVWAKPNRLIALLSHVFLFKMFIPEFECSFGGQFWFISTIIQLYLVFIPCCKLKEKTKDCFFITICTIVSLAWWIFLVVTGLDSNLVLGYFFLQYIWEFALGIVVAGWLFNKQDIKIPVWGLAVTGFIGLLIEWVMAYKGGAFKVFNDIPAFIGYGAIVLICYHFKVFYKMLEALNGISYEWYLLHILVFTCVFELKPEILSKQIVFGIFAFVLSLLIAVLYKKILILLHQS